MVVAVAKVCVFCVQREKEIMYWGAPIVLEDEGGWKEVGGGGEGEGTKKRAGRRGVGEKYRLLRRIRAKTPTHSVRKASAPARVFGR